MGAVPNQHGVEEDEFDAHCDHLLLLDHSRPKGDQIVGTYRVLTQAAARTPGRFYSAAEFDIAPLLDNNRKLLELGRSCLLPEYRGGVGVPVMWAALSDYCQQQGVEVLFGTASFPGTDPKHLAAGSIGSTRRGQRYSCLDQSLSSPGRYDREWWVYGSRF